MQGMNSDSQKPCRAHRQHDQQQQQHHHSHHHYQSQQKSTFSLISTMQRLRVVVAVILVFHSSSICCHGFSITTKPSSSSPSLSISSTTTRLRMVAPLKEKIRPHERVKNLPSTLRKKIAEKKASSSSSSMSKHHQQEKHQQSYDEEDEEPPLLPLSFLDWNSSGTIGSLLMQMHRKEEEMRRLNQTLLLDQQTDQAINLSRNSTFFSIGSSVQESQSQKGKQQKQQQQQQQQAKKQQQDTEVKYLANGAASPAIESPFLDIPLLYQQIIGITNISTTTTNATMTTTTTEEQEVPIIPFSKPAGRTERDIRNLALSIATNAKTVEQWSMFCQLIPGGGIFPIIECIREGAYNIRSIQLQDRSKNDMVDEEIFLAASSACNALVNLCSLSPELSAVITDGLLRANNIDSKHPKDGTNGLISRKARLSNMVNQLVTSATTVSSSPSQYSPTPLAPYYSSSTSLLSDLVTILNYCNHNMKDLESSTTMTNNTDVGSDGTRSRLFPTNAFRARRRLFRMKSKRDASISKTHKRWSISGRRNRREAHKYGALYVTRLLLAMTVASDSAVDAIRATEGLRESVLACSSYARKEQRRRWIRYPGELTKWLWRNVKERSSSKSSSSSSGNKAKRRPFIEAAQVGNDLRGNIQSTSNQVLAAMGYNQWVPKSPGQKGLRILCLDGGGSRGMAAVTAVNSLVESLGGVEVADCFDMIVGTSTGAIIAFLVGLRRESSELALQRYTELIQKVFTKSALSTPLMIFTTATYDHEPFMDILANILGEYSMLDTRGDPAVPLVFGVTSKMSSTPTHVALFRNYNYVGGELPDPFTIDPYRARKSLGLPVTLEHDSIKSQTYPRKRPPKSGSKQPGKKTKDGGSRHPGSFRVLQKYALRASTAAPTLFKPVLMGGEMYCDGGIVASNPTAIAIHEARNIYPDIPIELVVSIGTGGFVEHKSEPKIGWDGVIGQIVDSATDGEQIHHILEDILGDGGTNVRHSSLVSNTRYLRFNPVIGLPDEFPIDVTDPEKLQQLKSITQDYMNEPAQQAKIKHIKDLLFGSQKLFKLGI